MWLAAGMLWLASIGPFPDPLHCAVRGYLSTETGAVTLAREDGCDVHVFLIGLQMVMVHDLYWVLIEFQEAPGFDSFWYVWSASQAYVHGRPVPIVWGYTLKS